MARKPEAPVLLVRWYGHTKWLLERVDSFPKNQRFIFGTRLADTTLDIMELLIGLKKGSFRIFRYNEPAEGLWRAITVAWL